MCKFALRRAEFSDKSAVLDLYVRPWAGRAALGTMDTLRSILRIRTSLREDGTFSPQAAKLSVQYRGRGLSAVMLTGLFRRLAAEGFRSVHLLVARRTEAVYRRRGFELLGDHRMFGNDFLAAEKLL